MPHKWHVHKPIKKVRIDNAIVQAKAVPNYIQVTEKYIDNK